MIALIAPNTKPPTVTSTIKITTKRVSFSNPVFFRCPLSPKATHVTSFTEYIVKSILTRNVLFRKLQTVRYAVEFFRMPNSVLSEKNLLPRCKEKAEQFLAQPLTVIRLSCIIN